MKKQFVLSAAVIAVIAAVCLVACFTDDPADKEKSDFVPPQNSTQLTLDQWSDGSLTVEKREEWFKFTATAATQYIHFKKNVLDEVGVQLYNNLRVRPWQGDGTGAYKIGVNTSATAPTN